MGCRRAAVVTEHCRVCVCVCTCAISTKVSGDSVSYTVGETKGLDLNVNENQVTSYRSIRTS